MSSVVYIGLELSSGKSYNCFSPFCFSLSGIASLIKALQGYLGVEVYMILCSYMKNETAELYKVFSDSFFLTL